MTADYDISKKILDAAMSDKERRGGVILARLALVISYIIELQPQEKRQALFDAACSGIAQRCGLKERK